MPIYEYQCGGCGHEFTAIRRITDETMPECPECHRGPVEKKISLSAFHLKGSGWYKTDYAKTAGGTGKPAKKTPEASGEPSSSASGESKPAETKPAESKPASFDKASS